MAKRRLEREKGRREATADMSEDLSEGEKGDIVSDMSVHGDNTKARLARVSSVDAMEAWANQQKGKKLYIVLVRQEQYVTSFLLLNILVFVTILLLCQTCKLCIFTRLSIALWTVTKVNVCLLFNSITATFEV